MTFGRLPLNSWIRMPCRIKPELVQRCGNCVCGCVEGAGFVLNWLKQVNSVIVFVLSSFAYLDSPRFTAHPDPNRRTAAGLVCGEEPVSFSNIVYTDFY